MCLRILPEFSRHLSKKKGQTSEHVLERLENNNQKRQLIDFFSWISSCFPLKFCVFFARVPEASFFFVRDQILISLVFLEPVVFSGIPKMLDFDSIFCSVMEKKSKKKKAIYCNLWQYS